MKYNVIIKKGGDGAMTVEKRPKPEGPAHLVAIAELRRSKISSPARSAPTSSDLERNGKLKG